MKGIAPVCFSSAGADRVQAFRSRPVGDLILRGKTEALRAFEQFTREAFENAGTARYPEAFINYKRATLVECWPLRRLSDSNRTTASRPSTSSGISTGQEARA
jgi:hypothetical protein